MWRGKGVSDCDLFQLDFDAETMCEVCSVSYRTLEASSAGSDNIQSGKQCECALLQLGHLVAQCPPLHTNWSEESSGEKELRGAVHTALMRLRVWIATYRSWSNLVDV